MEKTGIEARIKAIEIMGRSYGFTLDEIRENLIFLSSRDSAGDEEPTEQIIINAKAFFQKLKTVYPEIKIRPEIVDEWVMFTITNE